MSDSPAIVLVTTSFPIAGDGSEAAGSFVSDLAEELSKHLPVRVVAPGRENEHEQRPEGIDIYRYAAPQKPLSTLRLWSPNDLFTIPKILASGLNATRQAVESGPTCHILALWALPSGHWARSISKETGIRYSVWTLGSDIWTLGKIPFLGAYLGKILSQAHKCYSDGLKLAEDTRKIARRNVDFLPSTRRITRTRKIPLKSAPPYRLLFLGRWHPNKGVDLLIEALKLLSDDDWRFIEAIEICGGGPLESLVRTGVDSLRAAGRPVDLRGYLDKPAAEEAILQADYLLIPSRIESIPVVFSDAIKLGCPILSTPVGDLPDLLSHSPTCGLIADTVSPSAFSTLISQALRQSTRLFTDGLAARAAKFSIEVSAQRLLSRQCIRGE